MWATSKSLGKPLQSDLPEPSEMPWTIAYCIRKREQVNSYAELPKDKRPPEIMTWWGTQEELDRWFDRVFKRDKDKKHQAVVIADIDDTDIG
jgi:hypothetical protein